MANFSITNSTGITSQPALAATWTAMIAVAASSGPFTNSPTYTGSRRGKIYDILVGTAGSPADNAVVYDLQRATINSSHAFAGAISSNSSKWSLDVADGGFSALVTVNATTVTSGALLTSTFFISSGFQELWLVGVNQRASYRWVAAPGSEFVYPAVAPSAGGNGLLLQAQQGTAGGYTGTVTATVLFQEQ